MIKRLLFVLALFPLTAVMGILLIASVPYWVIAKKDFLGTVNKISDYLKKLIAN